MKLFNRQLVQSFRKSLAFALQSAIAFVSTASLGILCDVPTGLLVSVFIVWAFCIGVSVVPETPEEIRERKNELDRRFPWI